MRFARLIAAPALLLAFALTCGTASAAPATVDFRDDYSAGTVVVKTSERRLYYVLGGGKALRYPVGVGKAGKAWAGSSYITRKVIRPDWAPPAEVKRDKPSLP